MPLLLEWSMLMIFTKIIEYDDIGLRAQNEETIIGWIAKIIERVYVIVSRIFT